jgi:hypothetical protein
LPSANSAQLRTNDVMLRINTITKIILLFTT